MFGYSLDLNFRCSNEDSYILAIPYYRMAVINPLEVLKRVKKLQEQSNTQVDTF